MVAYTDPDCLPYFQGGDSPCLNTGTLCEPSTVDCDFAAAVEVKLDEFDEVVDVVTNVPMAWVETYTPITVSADALQDEPVRFDTVRIDTANMVNLDANAAGITITRTGLYSVFIYAEATTNTVLAADFIELNISTLTSPPLVSHILSDTTISSGQAINLDNVLIVPQSYLSTYLEAGQVVTMTLNCNGALGGVVTTGKVSMGITWMGDLR